jgi:ribosomal protein L11 methyltransferase
MNWLQLRFVVDAALVERASDLLEGVLAQAVTTENAGADEFYEVAFPGTPDWQKVAVTGLFSEDTDPQLVSDFILNQLANETQEEIPFSIERLKDQDWERVWLKNFKPIKVGHRLWVCPSWCTPEAPDERNIFLDPGLAFGTGTHPTTHLCLRWLAKQTLATQRVLDYGAGSGILAIAALMSGAEYADAVDIDPLAVTAARENAERNGLRERMGAYLPSELPGGQYQLVIANILADVIIELRDTLLLHLAPGGKLILTGILQSQSTRVTQAFGEEFEFKLENSDQWSLLVGQRRK